MSLRARIASLVALTVAAILVAVGLGLQAITAATLVGAVDADLRAIAANIERDPRGALFLAGPGRDRLGGAGGLVQLVDERGPVQVASGRPGMRTPEQTADLPVDDTVLSVARGESEALLRTIDFEGVRLRVLVAPVDGRFAVQVARPLDEADAVIAALRVRTALLTLAGALLAGVVAWSVAGRSIRPVRTLTEAVESIRDGRDLARRALVEVGGDGSDEVARLAAAFDAMLGRLDASRIAQEQLAADASHELRTPLTSLRTNVEVLARDAERLAPDDRARLTEDVIVQLEELTGMVDGLVTLARLDAGREAHGHVDLSAVVEEVADTARRRHPQRAADLTIDVPAQDGGAGAVSVMGDVRELTLAVTAMVENAVKYTQDGGIALELTASAAGIDGGGVRVSVRDAGPGVDPQHLPMLFARFFRAPEARSSPGAGLGLALVDRVARAHGGHARATLVEPQGLEVSLVLPRAAPAAPAVQVSSRGAERPGASLGAGGPEPASRPAGPVR